jgi:biopolymer transport protein ExbB/TolQ
MLLRLEVVCFLLSFAYVLYYITDHIKFWYANIQEKRQARLERLQVREQKKQEIEIATEIAKAQQEVKNYVTPEVSEQIREIVKRAHTNIAR